MRSDRFVTVKRTIVGIEGTDEVTTIRRTTLRLFGVAVTSSVPSMPRKFSDK